LGEITEKDFVYTSKRRTQKKCLSAIYKQKKRRRGKREKNEKKKEKKCERPREDKERMRGED